MLLTSFWTYFILTRLIRLFCLSNNISANEQLKKIQFLFFYLEKVLSKMNTYGLGKGVCYYVCFQFKAILKPSTSFKLNFKNSIHIMFPSLNLIESQKFLTIMTAKKFVFEIHINISRLLTLLFHFFHFFRRNFQFVNMFPNNACPFL